MDDIFLGRGKQIAKLKMILDGFFDANRASALPPVVLISGQGGIGKSTLLRELHVIVRDRFEDCHRLDIDWQCERQENPSSFAIDSGQIDALAILRVVERHADQSIAGWKPKSYTQAKDEIDKAKAAAFKQASDLRDLHKSPGDRTSELADGVADAVEKTLTTFGGSKALASFAKTLMRFGIPVIPELVGKLHTKLGKSQTDLLVNADGHTARGLGEALRKAAVKWPILVTFDTYEIIDERDDIVRVMIRAAGPRVAWIVAGRRDLYVTRISTPKSRVNGYSEHDRHHYDVSQIDLTTLAREDIRDYFRRAAPKRPELEDAELESVTRATSAIPLAIKMAAEIWRKTGDVAKIFSTEELTAEEIVEHMVGRYEQHCISEEDRQTLSALVLADGDSGVLKAILLPDHDGDEKRYGEHLDRVRHRYAAVQHTSVRKPRLHDEPARFFRERLRSRALREEDWLQQFNDRAVKALCLRIDKLASHRSLENLCEEDDYVDAAIKVARHLFWRAEDEAWRWWTTRYVEGLAYSSRLRGGLLEEAHHWTQLSKSGRKRLVVFQAAERYSWRSEEQQERRKFLNDDAEGDGFADQRIENRHEKERQAIRLWSAASAFRREERQDQALEYLRSAQQLCSERAKGISSKIADRALNVSFQFYQVKDYKKAKEASIVAVSADPTSARAWRELGTDYSLLKKHNRAVKHHKKAIEINPEDHNAWRSLGTDYAHLKKYKKAIRYHKKAIEIYPEDHNAWEGLGNDYAHLEKYKKAIKCHKKVIEINPEDHNSWKILGNDYWHFRKYKKAIKYQKKAIEINPENYDAWRDLAASLTQLGRYDKAAEKLQKCFKINATDSTALEWHGYLHMIVGEQQKAIEIFERSIAVDDNNPTPFYLWGFLLYRADDWNTAAEKFRQAMTVDSKSLSALLSLLALHRLLEIPDDPPTLLDDTRRLVESDRDPIVQAQWLTISGEDDLALDKLAQAVQQTPDEVVKARFRPALHALRDHPRFLELTADAPGSKWETDT